MTYYQFIGLNQLDRFYFGKLHVQLYICNYFHRNKQIIPVYWGCENYEYYKVLWETQILVLTFTLPPTLHTHTHTLYSAQLQHYEVLSLNHTFWIQTIFITQQRKNHIYTLDCYLLYLRNSFYILEEIVKVAVFFSKYCDSPALQGKRSYRFFSYCVYGQTATTSKQTNTTWSHYCQTTTSELIWCSVRCKRLRLNNMNFSVSVLWSSTKRKCTASLFVFVG